MVYEVSDSLSIDRTLNEAKTGKLRFQNWRNLSCFDCRGGGGGGGGEYPVEPQYHCGDLHAGWTD